MKRTTQIVLRCTPEERERWLQLAADAGLSLSDTLRALLLWGERGENAGTLLVWLEREETNRNLGG